MNADLTTSQLAALDTAAEFLRINDLDNYADALEQRVHVIEIRTSSYGVQHPIICRPDLLACPVERAMSEMQSPPAPGLYVGHLPEDDRPGLWFAALNPQTTQEKP